MCVNEVYFILSVIHRYGYLCSYSGNQVTDISMVNYISI